MTPKYTVVIAEDHALLRAGMRSLLACEADIEVVGEAATGEDAVIMACALNPSVVLMDLNMPGRGGLYAIAEIRRRAPAVKVLVITMHKTDEYIQEALRAGASGYILKESGHDELRVAIRTILSGKLYLSADVSARVVATYLSAAKGEVETRTALDTLTTREREVLKMVAQGRSNKVIAQDLNLSVKTVEKHRSGVMRKLDLRNVAMLTSYAISNGIINL